MIDLLMITISTISFIITFIFGLVPGYEPLILFPISFAFNYYFFLKPIILKNNSIVVLLFTFYGILRYVIIPVVITLTGENESAYFLTSNLNSIRTSIWLMLYELFIISIFLYSNYSFKTNNIPSGTLRKDSSQVFLHGSNFVYLVLGLIGVSIAIIVAPIRENLSIFIIKTNIGTRVNEDLSSIILLFRQIVLTSIVMSYLTILSLLNERYKKTKKKKYFFYSMLASFINISIIVGERRIIQVYTAFASGTAINSLFPSFKKRTFKYITLFAILIIGFMSVYKFFNVFLYGSYTQALYSSSFSSEYSSELLQSYFYGPQNVAKAVDLANEMKHPIQRIIYDIFRSTIGLNFFVKDLMLTTSNVFNTYIYGFFVPSGHLLSGIGYGYLYFGFLLSPLISVIFIHLSLILERKLKTTNSLELKYIYSYILLRLAEPFSSMPSKLNVASLVIFSWGIVYLLSFTFKKIISIKKSY